MDPSQAYNTIMSTVHEKIYLSKVVIEFCEDDPNAAYEDLLNKIQVCVACSIMSMAYVAVGVVYIVPLPLYRRLFLRSP